ncbi:pilus assembly protein TadG-related protein [Pseudotabrizicola sp. L79]|uniref:pilus assembly protein TadG-related protein n=1 Tax=Pseudotabrizicola sp. L79 TaxID=3118402 RepID=UPI002F95CB15
MNRKTEAAAEPRASAWGDFLRKEDGTVLFFAVCMMLVMLMLAGMGVDIMRFETVRNELQQTADRAALASASITQELDPDDLVTDYFAKAGIEDKLSSVQVTTGLNFRTVRVEARADTNPIFLNLYGKRAVDEIEARALSVAEQRITNVEIVMVLDVSGSMSGTKLANLKTSAKEFVNTVINADGEGRISIAIVPYNGQVNMGQDLQNLFVNRIGDHNVSNVNCFDLPASVYSGLGMSLTTELPVTGHVDTYSSTSYTSSYVSTSNSNATPNANNRWCPVSTRNVILPPTNNIATLESHINNLESVGATSINAGMKWGMALMDPGSRPIISAMVANGKTPSNFLGRPYEYVDDESMKVIVLMTDGEHFPEERLNDGYRTENSDIYRANDGLYSMFDDSKVDSRNSTRLCNSRPFWVPHLGAWHSRAWNGTSPSSSACYVPSTSTSGATRQRWDQLWATVRMTWVAWQFYARPNGNSSSAYYNAMDMFRTKTEVSDMNSQLQGVCSRARAAEVIVYGIAFEAPTNGAAQIEACATTTSHYFNATGLEIQSAFRAIASNISQLRLTQ